MKTISCCSGYKCDVAGNCRRYLGHKSKTGSKSEYIDPELCVSYRYNNFISTTDESEYIFFVGDEEMLMINEKGLALPFKRTSDEKILVKDFEQLFDGIAEARRIIADKLKKIERGLK